MSRRCRGRRAGFSADTTASINISFRPRILNCTLHTTACRVRAYYYWKGQQGPRLTPTLTTDTDTNWLRISPHAGGGSFGQCKIKQKTLKMAETLSNGYLSRSTQWELSNEYQQDRV